MTEVIDVEAIEERGSALDKYIPEIRRTPEQVKVAIESVERLLHDHMREKIDYGKIPGTPKPTLYKAGAERLSRFFGLGAIVEQVRATERWPESDDDQGFLLYTYRVGIGPITPEGVIPIAWCEASANSRERKFVKVPVYEVANTLMKMSQKRAYVGAVLMATNTSDFFSQDLEDLPPEMLGEDKPKPQVKPKPIPTPMTGGLDDMGEGGPEDVVLPWGNKHRGETLGEIMKADPSYLTWLAKALAKKEADGELPDDQVSLKSAVDLIVENL